MIPTITTEWVFTAAQTDFQLVAVDATHRMVVTYAQATTAHSTGADVTVRLGLATATLPTITNNSAAGGGGVFFSHGGIVPGGGAIAANGGAPIVAGGADEELRITCSAATGGDLRIIVTYWLDTLS